MLETPQPYVPCGESPSLPLKGQPLGFPTWSLFKMVLIQMVHFQAHILKKDHLKTPKIGFIKNNFGAPEIYF